MINNKKTMYVLMTVLVIAWGLDYVFAKAALNTLDPLSLLFYKYGVGLIIVLIIKFKTDRKVWMRKQDIKMFVICAFFGEIVYFYCEYSAMDYLPIALITIIVSFVPIVSVIIERIVYKRRTSKKIIAGIIVCTMGVALIIGVDFGDLLSGRAIGYLLAFGSVFAWNAYNFMTAALHEKYTSVTLTANQLICTLIMLLPYVLRKSPPITTFTVDLVLGLLYLGVIAGGVGFMIQVKALHVLGPTTTALFSNFLPVTATFFGWIVFGETVLPMQMVGGAVIIASGCFVIREKGKIEVDSDERKIEFNDAH